LKAALENANRDPQVRVIVMTGAGDAFCAGAEMKRLIAEVPPLQRRVEHAELATLFDLLTSMGKPVVAKVSGQALGAGLGLVAACHLAIAADSAEFGITGIKVGIWPMTVMPLVFRSLPRKAAMELIITGKKIDADEAERIGLINRHVPAEHLDQAVSELAKGLVRWDPDHSQRLLEGLNSTV
jgi:methylglutaconyl-CoA hydratase